MARAITANELTKLRGKQSSRLYLALHQPAVVYSAQVDQASFEVEPDAVAYKNGSGTLANVKPGMTMLIGTAAGKHDVGMVRIRKEPGTSTFFIGRTGGINWQNNLYLTVINEFRPWAVPVSYYNGVAYLDEDVSYTNEHSQYRPVIVMGPPAVLWLKNGTAVLSPKAEESWVFGSTISGYSWSAPGASATSGMNTAEPQVTYNSAGQYTISCTVTAANGKSATGYRPVFVFGGNVKPIEVKSLPHCAGDAESGGWAAEVEIVDLAGAVVRDGMLAVLFTLDEWNGTVEVVGVPDGYGNILMSGWINGDTISVKRGYGTVSFRIEGTAAWLARLASLPGVIKKSENAAQAWDEFEIPTVTRAVWHLLTERSTLGLCTDILLDVDGRRMPAFDLSGGSLWEQIKQVCGSAQYIINSDRCGRVYGGIDPALRRASERSGIPVVMDITKADWADEMVIHEQTEKVSLLEIKGIRDDTPEERLISRAPGYLPRYGGDWRVIDWLVFDNQEHANFLSGQMLAVLNNRFEVEVALGMNNRFIDICPAQYVTLTLASGDTPFGAIFNAAKFFPRRVEYQFEDGGIRTKVILEKEVFGSPGVTIIPESPGGDENLVPDEPRLPNYPLFPPPRSDWPEYAPPPVENVDDCLSGNMFVGPYILTPPIRVLDTEEIAETEIYIPCKLRDGTVDHKSMVAITGYMRYQAGGIWYSAYTLSDWTVEALDASGNVVAVGVNSFGNVGGLMGRVSAFYPVGPLQIDRLRIRLSGAYGSVGNWSRAWNANYGWGGWKPAETTTTIGNDIYVDPVTDEWKVFRHVQTYWRIQDGKIGLRRDVPPHYTESRMVYEFPKNTVRVIGGVSKTIVMYPQDWTYVSTFYHLTSNHAVVPNSYQLNLWDGLVKTYNWLSWQSYFIEKIVINSQAGNWWECASVIMQDYTCAVQRYQWIIQGIYLFNVCPS
jgi:hypothetical protein